MNVLTVPTVMCCLFPLTNVLIISRFWKKRLLNGPKKSLKKTLFAYLSVTRSSWVAVHPPDEAERRHGDGGLTCEQVHRGEGPLQLGQQDAEEAVRGEGPGVGGAQVVHHHLLVALELQLEGAERQARGQGPGIRD